MFQKSLEDVRCDEHEAAVFRLFSTIGLCMMAPPNMVEALEDKKLLLLKYLDRLNVESCVSDKKSNSFFEEKITYGNQICLEYFYLVGMAAVDYALRHLNALDHLAILSVLLQEEYALVVKYPRCFDTIIPIVNFQYKRMDLKRAHETGLDALVAIHGIILNPVATN